MSTLITLLPGWLIAILLFALLWGCSILGSRLRIQLRVSNETTYATSAAVSLLALLIGFTFSLALSRYDNRRELVVEEAAAIFSLWQRLPLLPNPHRTELADLDRRYADQRLIYFTFGVDQDRALIADQKADAIIERMWVIVRELDLTAKQPLVTRMLMDNLTRIDDAAWRREAMAREHIPFVVVDLLVIFSLLTAVSMGLCGPQDRRVHPTHLIFFGLTSIAIMLVLDLDRPRSGLVLVSQHPIIEVAALMADHADDMTRTTTAMDLR